MAKKIGTFLGYALVAFIGVLAISVIILAISIVWHYVGRLW